MKSQTLKENRDFRRLYNRGKSIASKTLVTYSMKNRSSFCRFGITTSKKIGNAVERNRSRRVIRAAYQELEPRISGNWDFVFVARGLTSRVKMQTVKKDMENHFKAMGVIDEKD